MEIERNPYRFWYQFRRLRGSIPKETIFLNDEADNKTADVGEIEEKFREYWSGIFSITQEENLNYDAEHERRVEEEVRGRVEEMTPRERVDGGRVQILDRRPFCLQEFRNALALISSEARRKDRDVYK